MGRPYSDDLRTRVAASVVAGRSCRAVAEVFGVSAASAVKWSQRLRQTGSAAAKAMGGARRAVLAGERDWLRARIKVAPDLTLRALAAELAERGVVVSHWAVWKFCQDEALTFKKKASCQASRIAPMSPAVAPVGIGSKHHWSHRAWCSSTRPGPRRTWCVCMAVRPVGSG